MKKKVVLNSPRLLELRRKKHKTARKKMVIIFVFLLIIVSSISFASRLSMFNINKINITGNSIVEKNDIENIVKKDLTGHYLWLFPKTNFLIYPKHKIISDLSFNLKRLKDISININNFKLMEVNVSEYEGKYLWCGSSLPLAESSSNQKCYFMDTNGYVFDEAPYFSGEVYFKFYGAEGPSDVNPTGTYYMKDKFAKIIEFKNTLEKLNIKTTAFWLDENKENANFGISRQEELGPKIIFRVNDDYSTLSENLQASIFTEPLRSDLRNKLSSLLYLDLRFGNKVYYKFK